MVDNMEFASIQGSLKRKIITITERIKWVERYRRGNSSLTDITEECGVAASSICAWNRY